MAGLVFTLLLLAMAGHCSATWCVCKEGMSDAMLQKTLDYACGAGADCNPTHQNGPCFNPNTVRAHCNYAVNSYFQRNRQQTTACDFSGTANVVNNDPSGNGCMYPASASSATSTSTNGNNPLVTTPNSGGVLGPSGMNNDVSHGGIVILSNTKCIATLLLSVITMLALSWRP